MFGKVWSPKLKKYIRIGGSPSLKVIRDELTRDDEWYKRVNFLVKNKGKMGDNIRKMLSEI
jgi:hypothetical protein